MLVSQGFPVAATLSRHAAARCQQRSIPMRLLGVVLLHADSRVHVGGGVIAAMIKRRKLQKLARSGIVVDPARLEGLVVLYDPAVAAVITAMRAIGSRSRRYRRN